MQRTTYFHLGAICWLLFGLQGACVHPSSDAAARETAIVSQPLSTIADIRRESGSLAIKLKNEDKNVLCVAESPDASYVDRAYRNVYEEMTDADQDPIFVSGRVVGNSFRIAKLKVHGQEFGFSVSEEDVGVLPGP